MNTKKEENLIKENGFINVDPNNIDLISNIQKSGKYILDLAPDKSRQWIIRKNPNHFTWWKRELAAGFIGAVLALTGQYIVIKLQSKSTEQESKKGSAIPIQTFDTSKSPAN